METSNNKQRLFLIQLHLINNTYAIKVLAIQVIAQTREERHKLLSKSELIVSSHRN